MSTPELSLSHQQVNLTRITGQHLGVRAKRDELLTVITSVCGINAQLPKAMLLSLRARIEGLEREDVTRALDERREIVRTWAMRGTLHLMASSEVNWLISILGPVFLKKARRRYHELGLTEGILEIGLAEIPAILRDTGPLTRWELMDRLEEKGLSIERKSQAPIHLIRYVALHGMICLGPDRSNGETTYTVLERQSKGRDTSGRESDILALVKRYLIGYGPAEPQDFAAWSGVDLSDVKNAWKHIEEEEGFAPVRLQGQLWILAKNVYEEALGGGRAERTVRLLPAFDPYVLGYSNRDYFVRPEHYRDIYHGGQTVPVVLADGSAEGVWRYELKGKRISIDVRLFAPISRATRDLIQNEAEDIGRLFRASLTLDIK